VEILISISFVGMFGLLLWLRHGGYIERIYFPSESRFRREAWRSAARAAGLTGVVETSRDLSGWAGRVHVRLSRYETEVSGTRLVLSGPGLAGGFTVRPEALETTLRAAVGQREVEIGDETFDRLAWIQGSPALAHALLDRPAREAFRSVFGGYLQRAGKMPFLASALLDDGTLSLDVPEVPKRKGTTEGALDALFAAITGKEASEGGSLGRPERLPEVLEAALAFARRLEPPADVARRIAENLRDEPLPGVRVRSLTVLVREFPDHPATREALLAAREDPDAEVRLRAAAELGEEGRDVLLALAEGEGAEDATTARAVTALGTRLDPGEARRLLSQALRTRRTATARACIEVLGRQRGPDSVAMLARVLAVERGELAVAAADALGATRDPAAEAPLVEALDSRPRELRLAAARALGLVGTAAAVPPLKAAEARHSDLARAARQAIAEIQARLTGAEPGQLSLATAPGEAGQLSLADADPAGRLTLAESVAGAEGRAATEVRAAGEVRAASEERTATEGRAATEVRAAGEERTATEGRAVTEVRAAGDERTATEVQAAGEERTATRERTATEQRTATRERTAPEQGTAAADHPATDARRATEDPPRRPPAERPRTRE